MRALPWIVGGALLTVGCSPPYVDTYAPSDASFTVDCGSGCGAAGRASSLVIGVTFTGGERQYALCCEHRAALLARLATVRDHWCDGLDVPDQSIGGLIVGTTVSEITQRRGATLDDGQGYVAFNCDDWLDQLIAKLTTTTCCGSL